MASFGERVVGAMRLDTNTFEEIERDPSAMGQTVGVITLAAVSFGIGNLYWGGITGIVSQILISLIGYVVWSCVVWIIGTKVMPDPATKADFAETFRVIGFAAAPGVLGIVTIIPILGWVIGLLLWVWQVAAMVVAVRSVLDYTSTGKALIVVAIGVLLRWFVAAILGLLFLGSAILSGAFGR
jgi:hypothetical protein